MRKIEKTVIGAFIRGESASVDNTNTDGMSLWLHSNLIARREVDKIRFGNAGWDTRTTQSRLNALLELTGSGKRVITRDFAQYVIDADGNREPVKSFTAHTI